MFMRTEWNLFDGCNLKIIIMIRLVICPFLTWLFVHFVPFFFYSISLLVEPVGPETLLLLVCLY